MALMLTLRENDSVYLKCSDGIIQVNTRFKEGSEKYRIAFDAPASVNILRGEILEDQMLNEGWIFAGTDSSGWKLWKNKVSGLIFREIEVVRRIWR